MQGVNSSETLDPLFERDKQGFTREEVSPGPGVTKGSNRKTPRQRMSEKVVTRTCSYTSSGGMYERGERPVWREACAKCMPRSADVYYP